MKYPGKGSIRRLLGGFIEIPLKKLKTGGAKVGLF
jgi:hypothetical protein